MTARDVTWGVRRSAVLVLLVLLSGDHADARERPAFAARSGVELAAASAQRWAADAQLVYVENDEALDPQGGAPRWGYLFHSQSLERSRAYSVRDGRVLVAEDLEMRFEAAPLQSPWIDSSEAIAIAEQGAGANFREKHKGTATTMLLMRGAFQDDDPDPATWTVIYTAPGAPALFVMVDALAGKVRRTWRG